MIPSDTNNCDGPLAALTFGPRPPLRCGLDSCLPCSHGSNHSGFLSAWVALLTPSVSGLRDSLPVSGGASLSASRPVSPPPPRPARPQPASPELLPDHIAAAPKTRQPECPPCWLDSEVNWALDSWNLDQTQAFLKGPRKVGSSRSAQVPPSLHMWLSISALSGPVTFHILCVPSAGMWNPRYAFGCIWGYFILQVSYPLSYL